MKKITLILMVALLLIMSFESSDTFLTSLGNKKRTLMQVSRSNSSRSGSGRGEKVNLYVGWEGLNAPHKQVTNQKIN